MILYDFPSTKIRMCTAEKRIRTLRRSNDVQTMKPVLLPFNSQIIMTLIGGSVTRAVNGSPLTIGDLGHFR